MPMRLHTLEQFGDDVVDLRSLAVSFLSYRGQLLPPTTRRSGGSSVKRPSVGSNL
jgi:hypothetical protein